MNIKHITESSTVKDLGADSLDIVYIIDAIEEEFSIEINDGQVDIFVLIIQEIVDFIDKLCAPWFYLFSGFFICEKAIFSVR